MFKVNEILNGFFTAPDSIPSPNVLQNHNLMRVIQRTNVPILPVKKLDAVKQVLVSYNIYYYFLYFDSSGEKMEETISVIYYVTTWVLSEKIDLSNAMSLYKDVFVRTFRKLLIHISISFIDYVVLFWQWSYLDFEIVQEIFYPNMSNLSTFVFLWYYKSNNDDAMISFDIIPYTKEIDLLEDILNNLHERRKTFLHILYQLDDETFLFLDGKLKKYPKVNLFCYLHFHVWNRSNRWFMTDALFDFMEHSIVIDEMTINVLKLLYWIGRWNCLFLRWRSI
jgi:hypothetical protein